MTTSTAKQNRIAPMVFAVLVLAITFIPYLLGYANAEGRRYLWLGYNFDDASVYLTWMRQTAAPSLRVFNLFTTDPQTGLVANPLFLLLGLVHWLTKIPLLGVFHLARLLFGYTLLMSVWHLVKTVLKTDSQRWFALLLVALSAGLGWLPVWNATGFDSPVDRWQPEAITFLSLYLNPLFTASMTLQVLVLANLFKADQTGDNRLTIKAGVSALLLSLIHGYDVITLSVVWTLYLIVRTIQKHDVVRVWKQALTVAGIALPGVLFMLYQIKSESVFRERIAVATLSAPIYWVALGYGIPFLLAVYALARQRKSDRNTESIFLSIWMIGNVLAAYLPVSFQRKMLQGAHIPISILAAIAVNLLVQNKSRAMTAGIKGSIGIISALTVFAFMYRDIQNANANITQTQLQRPFLRQGEQIALDWVAKNTPPNATIQPLPHITLITDNVTSKTQTAISDTTLATILPWMTGRAVFCGHFGETPHYTDRLNQLNRFLIPNTPDTEKISLLRSMNVQYLLFSQTSPSDIEADSLVPIFRHRLPLPKYLKQVYSSDGVEIYEIHLP